MNEILNELERYSVDINYLQKYINIQFAKIYDYFVSQNHTQLVQSRTEINKYIQLKRNIITSLDIKEQSTLAFINLLLYATEQLGLVSSFKYLYDYLLINNFEVDKRLKAASYFMIGIKKDDDYLSIYGNLLNTLVKSIEEENESEKKVLMTFINYYSQVLFDFGEFNQNVIKELQKKVKKSLDSNKYEFLKNPIIEQILSIDTTDFKKAYNDIHKILDEYLGKIITFPESINDFIVEEGTTYATMLHNRRQNFGDIRSVSVELNNANPNATMAFAELNHGIAVIDTPEQAVAYMFSYGKMHYEKVVSAIQTLPPELFNVPIDIIDWGCGQAISSLAILDYFKEKKINSNLLKFTLIEPSVITLKRASLHLTHYNIENVITINKDFDSLESNDFSHINNITNLHFFSNVLDIDQSFNFASLLELINSSFHGKNYIVVTSPYINQRIEGKIDLFVDYFKKKYKKYFKIYDHRSLRKGEWENDWTLISRVFSFNRNR